MAAKVAVVLPAGTVREGETGSRGLSQEMATMEPLGGAALERVTVQEVAAPELRDVGVQAKEEMTTEVARLTVALLD